MVWHEKTAKRKRQPKNISDPANLAFSFISIIIASNDCGAFFGGWSLVVGLTEMATDRIGMLCVNV